MCKCLSVLSGKGKQYGLMLAGALLATMTLPLNVTVFIGNSLLFQGSWILWHQGFIVNDYYY